MNWKDNSYIYIFAELTNIQIICLQRVFWTFPPPKFLDVENFACCLFCQIYFLTFISFMQFIQHTHALVQFFRTHAMTWTTSWKIWINAKRPYCPWCSRISLYKPNVVIEEKHTSFIQELKKVLRFLSILVVSFCFIICKSLRIWAYLVTLYPTFERFYCCKVKLSFHLIILSCEGVRKR